MKICRVCLQSNILCSGCTKKLEDGKISNLDVELSRAVHKISRETGYDIDFMDLIESGGRLYVLVDSEHAGRFIGPGGRTIKMISSMLGRQIKMLERATGSERHVIERMIGTPILGVNKVYSGNESYKVRVEKKHMRNVQPLSDVVSKVMGKRINFVFE